MSKSKAANQTQEQKLAEQIISEVNKRLRLGESSVPTPEECLAFKMIIAELVGRTAPIVRKLKLEGKDAAARELEESQAIFCAEALAYPRITSSLPTILNISPEQNLQTCARAVTTFLKDALPYLGQPVEQKPTEASGAKAEKTTKKQPWRDDDPDYILLSNAIVSFTDSKIPLSTMSSRLKPDSSPVRYMRRGQRCKVHIGDFIKYIKTKYPSMGNESEIADEFLADAEARKKQIDKTKRIHRQ